MVTSRRISSPPAASFDQAVRGVRSAIPQHALPHGMRDLLPSEARQLSVVGRQVASCFERFGFQLVSLPSFEYADVLERARGDLDSTTILRFVEPESGEVVALRPDMTTQVARLVSGQLATLPLPARLSYYGSVMRRRHERARRHREVSQAGFELVGTEGVEADLEVLEVLISATRAAGLEAFTVDLSHAGICRALIERLPETVQGAVRDALSAKDASELRRLLRSEGVDKSLGTALTALPALQGGQDVWKHAQRYLRATPAESALDELEQLWQRACERGFGQHLLLDIGEPAELHYYTGVVYQLFAPGPGESLGAGGRYDRLLAHFGMSRPAAGFAFDLGNLCWALRAAGAVTSSPARVVVATPFGSAQTTAPLLSALRERQVHCCAVPRADATDYASVWGYSHMLGSDQDAVTLTRLAPAPSADWVIPWAAQAEGTETLAERICNALSART